MKTLLQKPADLGALEYVARLLLVPLAIVVGWAVFDRGWAGGKGPATILVADLLVAVRWQRHAPFRGRVQNPGPGLAPLSKVVMVGALLLVPAMAGDREWLVATLVAVMALASAGLWLRWRWVLWAWIAYAVAAMADWVADAATLLREAVRSEVEVPMSRLKPLLATLPSALFAIAVLLWVLEWRRRAFPRATAGDS